MSDRQPSSCFICGNTRHTFRGHYARCEECGHQVLTATNKQGYIINDELDETSIRKPGFLDRFKVKVTAQCLPSTRAASLLDVGSASGKFLLLSRHLFSRSQGLEITPEAVEFSRGLGLDVQTDIKQTHTPVNLATMWHSLEHIPTPAMKAILDHLSRHLADDGRVLISVPNAESWQARLLGSKAPFYDVPNHLHQFSPESLARLMDTHGFKRERRWYSYPYSLFGCLQGVLNLFNTRHNYLYYRMKRGWEYGDRRYRPLLDAYNGMLALLFAGLSAVLGLAECMSPEKQGVLTICFKKKNDSK